MRDENDAQKPVDNFSDISQAHKDRIANSEWTKYIYDRLRNAGLNSTIAAGIMGNMYEESWFNPNATSKPGSNGQIFKGLVQLSPTLWDHYQTYLANNGFDNTVEHQMDYLIPILTERNNRNPHNIPNQNIYTNEWGGYGNQDKFLTGTYATPTEASDAFYQIFERPSAATAPQRGRYAEYIASLYNYKWGGILKRVK